MLFRIIFLWWERCVNLGRKLSKKSVDRNQWHQYLLAAKEYNQGAMNNYDNELWTSASILFVHAAIAYTDALTIKAGSVKSAGDDHGLIIYLVEQILSLSSEDKKALNRLGKILGEKSKVSYGGKVYTKKQADKIKMDFNRYQTWITAKIDSIA